MTAKHTPGPWVISTPTQGYEVCTMHGLPNQPTEDGPGQTWVYIRPESMFRDGEWHWPDEQEQLANARLIVAAPDLLDALKDALAAMTAETIGTTRMDDPAWYGKLWDATAKARAAIAKAEGNAQ